MRLSRRELVFTPHNDKKDVSLRGDLSPWQSQHDIVIARQSRSDNVAISDATTKYNAHIQAKNSLTLIKPMTIKTRGGIYSYFITFFSSLVCVSFIPR